MYLAINIIGLIVFLAIGWLFSKDRKAINWRAVLTMTALNLVMAWFLTSFPIGLTIVKGAAAGFDALVQVSYQGIAFAIPSMVNVKSMDFFVSVLLPILMIVPLFDILTYIGVLPWIIKWIGRGLSFITRQPKFESFFAVEMMFLGNTEALAVSSLQLKRMSAKRDLTLAMMSMSCVTASIADGTVEADGKKEPFFSFLGDSILSAGRLVLIIAANVIAFVALAALVDKLLGLIHPWVSLEHLLGIIMFPFAWLMGLNPSDAFQFAQYMGEKLVTNEFVVMGKVTGKIATTAFSEHYRAVLTVFVTSFANFSTVGMIIGCFKSIVDREKNDLVSKNVPYLLLSGILVSLLSAATVGLFAW